MKRFGDVEMLKVGRMYYSRTKNLYASKLNLSGGYIYDHKFYVAILIIMLPSNAILTILIWLVFHGDMPVSSVVIMTVTIGYADGWWMEASCDGHRREILSCDRLWGKKKYIGCHFPGRGGREMFGRDGATGKACEGDTEYGGIREK